MTTDNLRLGTLGENLAAAYLHHSGWLIMDRNWRRRGGELDIVALDHDDVVVCEVKTRLSRIAGEPLEAVTPRKARRLRELAEAWLAERGSDLDGVRVDVIGVRVETDGRHTIQHIRGAA